MATYKQLLTIGFGDSLSRTKKAHKLVSQKWYSALLLLQRDIGDEPISFNFLNDRIGGTKDNDHKEALINFLASTPKPNDYPVKQSHLEFAIHHVKNIMENCV